VVAELTKYAQKLAALGQEARIAIVRLLLRAHPNGMVVGELQSELDIAPSTLSHHLDLLHRHGLVQQQREGKFVRYSADLDGMMDIVNFLTAECRAQGGVCTTPSAAKRPPARR
jgi:DNA-binding transcriptional ArsR family regulator